MKFQLLSVFVFCWSSLQAQCIFSTDLKDELDRGLGNYGLILDKINSYGMMASSTLPAEEKTKAREIKLNKPDSALTYEDEMGIQELQVQETDRVEDERCRYSASNLQDGDSSTAWVEGEKGDGVGEVVMTYIGMKPSHLKIWSGYGKSEALFRANNRPAEVRVYLIGSYCYRLNYHTDRDKALHDLKILGSEEVVLKDINTYQELPVPKQDRFSAIITDNKECNTRDGDWKNNPVVYLVAIKILSVYKGSRYDDTCISEIITY